MFLIDFMNKSALSSFKVQLSESVTDHVLNRGNGHHRFNPRSNFNAGQKVGEEIFVLIEAHLEFSLLHSFDVFNG